MVYSDNDKKETQKINQDIALNNVRVSVNSPIESCINKIASTTSKGGLV